MKKFVFLPVLLALVAAVVFVGAALGNNGPQSSAVGGFQGTLGNQVAFSAHSDPSGANPSGSLNQIIPQVRKDRFTVTCFAVSGNQAALGLSPADAATAANFPDGRVLVVADNGNPVGGQPVDAYSYYLTAASTCALFVNSPTFFTPVSGNFVVSDGS